MQAVAVLGITTYGLTSILQCRSGSASSSKAWPTASSLTSMVINWGGIDVALGDHVQRVRELVRVVFEHELHADFLGDRKNGCVESAACTSRRLAGVS